MAADTKIEKTVARVMMQMTNENNTKLAASIKKPADQIARVGCATCHRGAADSRHAATAASASTWRCAGGSRAAAPPAK